MKQKIVNFGLGVILLLLQIINRTISRNINKNGLSLCVTSLFSSIVRVPFVYFHKGQRFPQNPWLYIIAAAYETQILLTLKFAPKLPPIVLAACNQSKFVFLAILSWFLLGRGVSRLQMLAIVIFIAGLILPDIDAKNQTLAYPMACLGSVSAAFCSSIGAILFEKFLRKKVIDFRAYMLAYAQAAIAVACAFAVIEFYICSDLSIIKCISSPDTYYQALIICATSVVIMYASTRVEPVRRGLYIQVIQTLSTVILEFKEDRKWNWKKLASLFIVNSAVMLFDHKNIIALFSQDRKKSIISVLEHKNVVSVYERSS